MKHQFNQECNDNKYKGNDKLPFFNDFEKTNSQYHVEKTSCKKAGSIKKVRADYIKRV